MLVKLDIIPKLRGENKNIFETTTLDKCSNSLGIQSPSENGDWGVYNHLRNARYLGSMKPFSERDWIARD